MNKFQSNRIGILPLYHEWISVKPDWNISVVLWLKSFSRMVLRKFALYNHCVRQIHKMLHDDLRDSENRFLEFFWTWTFEIVRSRSSNNAKFSSFEHFHCNWTVRYNLKRFSKIGSDIFLFRSFHFSFYNYKYRHSQTESEHLIGTTIIVRFRIFEIHRDSELTV